jgi:hypothetical protein
MHMTFIPYIRSAPRSRQPLMTRKQVAVLLGVTVSCLEKWAELRKGPKFYRQGTSKHSHTGYRIEDVEQFARECYGDEFVATLATCN